MFKAAESDKVAVRVPSGSVVRVPLTERTTVGLLKHLLENNYKQGDAGAMTLALDDAPLGDDTERLVDAGVSKTSTLVLFSSSAGKDAKGKKKGKRGGAAEKKAASSSSSSSSSSTASSSSSGSLGSSSRSSSSSSSSTLYYYRHRALLAHTNVDFASVSDETLLDLPKPIVVQESPMVEWYRQYIRGMLLPWLVYMAVYVQLIVGTYLIARQSFYISTAAVLVPALILFSYHRGIALVMLTKAAHMRVLEKPIDMVTTLGLFLPLGQEITLARRQTGMRLTYENDEGKRRPHVLHILVVFFVACLYLGLSGFVILFCLPTVPFLIFAWPWIASAGYRCERIARRRRLRKLAVFESYPPVLPSRWLAFYLTHREFSPVFIAFPLGILSIFLYQQTRYSVPLFAAVLTVCSLSVADLMTELISE